MQQKLTVLKTILLAVIGVLLGLNFEVSTSHAANETESLSNDKTKFGNITR